MKANSPSFSITEKIINLVAEIAEHVGKIQGINEYKQDLRLRKINRFRSIQSSAAIEGNTLSLEQVSDIISGKRVIGNPREIKEIKNIYDVYEQMLKFNPLNIKDFLFAHKLMTSDLVDESGKFRSSNVGVFSGKKIVHLGARPDFIQVLMDNLFEWAKKPEVHPLIKSSIIHFEIEFIHPFADGNGRMGRFWQTLILSKWQSIFAWIPIETVIYKNQQEYYRVLGNAENTADSTEFIEFMLNAIVKTLNELTTNKISDKTSDIISDKLTKSEREFLINITEYLKNNGEIDSYKAQLLTGKSPQRVRQYFAILVKNNILAAVGANKGRKYRLIT
ncbi:MAG: Fic family protein [Rickettsiales bacterium]|jgi:Fic family protein|nr:Fic family protein [Rickettsiales bacterium]